MLEEKLRKEIGMKRNLDADTLMKAILETMTMPIKSSHRRESGHLE